MCIRDRRGAPLALLQRYGRTPKADLNDVLLTMGMADGAAFIASGIIDSRKDEVIAGLEKAGLAVGEVKEKRGWEGIVCKKA